jgi:rod shape-determining protein MreC
MRSLLNFLIRHSSLFLFLFLEGIALIMLSSSHSYHNSIATNIFGGITARLSTTVENTKSFTRLRQVNRQLAYENAMLRQKLEGTQKVSPANEITVNDTINRLYYSYITAKVVNNSVNKQKNFFTLDRGLTSGVSNGMAVITPDGIAGVIVRSSQNYSIAMSVLNLDFKQSVKLAKSDYFGSMSWNGKNHMYVEVSEIPHHVAVAEGDTIITTGFSALFPEALMVGTVVGEPVMGGDFLTLKVKLSTDLKKMTYVYIIKSHYKSERMGLEAEVANE